MSRIARPLAWVMSALLLLVLIVFLLNPTTHRLAPSWLYYDLIVRQFAPLPAGAEQFVLAAGRDFCSIGRDSDCGGYKITNARSLQVGPAARGQGTAAAWCIDYVVLRRNTGRLTGQLIYWAGIPRAMVVAELNDARYTASPVERCDFATLNP
jgi:hypothetical protein